MAGTTGLEPEQGHIGWYRRVLSSCVFNTRVAPSSTQYRAIFMGVLHEYCTKYARMCIVLALIHRRQAVGCLPPTPRRPARLVHFHSGFGNRIGGSGFWYP